MSTLIDRDLLTTFWFEAEKGLGIGVTAYSLEDALSLMKNEKLLVPFKPYYEKYIVDIVFGDLELNHVVPNMGVMVIRGIWYPNFVGE